MDYETDTDTYSLCGSETSKDNYKTPETSDCESYATPLATSFTDITTIVIQKDTTSENIRESSPESGERTPVSTARAISPPLVKQIMYLQKPKILKMTTREIRDESSSEEEFYDISNDNMRDAVQQLLSRVSEQEAFAEVGETGCKIRMNLNKTTETPILNVISGKLNEINEETSEESSSSTPVVTHVLSGQESVVEKSVSGINNEKDVVIDVINDVMDEIEKQEDKPRFEDENDELPNSNDEAFKIAEIDHKSVNSALEDKTVIFVETQDSIMDSQLLEFKTPLVTGSRIEIKLSPEEHLVEIENNAPCTDPVSTTNTENPLNVEDVETRESYLEAEANKVANSLVNVSVQITQGNATSEKLVVSCKDITISEPVFQTQQDEMFRKNILNLENAMDSKQNVNAKENKFDHVCYVENDNVNYLESEDQEVNQKRASIVIDTAINNAEASTRILDSQSSERKKEDDPILHATDVEDYIKCQEMLEEDFSEIARDETPVLRVNERTPDVSEVAEGTRILSNRETEPESLENENQLPTLIISDDITTSSSTADDEICSGGSSHEAHISFYSYSSEREECLSSSTSSESFEFAEPVLSNYIQDEKAQALRTSIIERYPSTETDDDELESVGDEMAEDLLAVKQISAEVQQLVAAINAFGREEEQQMSAFLVGKKMAVEKKRKSAMNAVVTSPCHDQTVQTDNNSFILVDRHIPEAMENLQVEIEKLQADLAIVRNGEKELIKINSKLKMELEESQQTIDGIEVEAEQQYTELTSEIDGLCEIVQRKDQELSALKEKIVNMNISENNLKDDVDSQRLIVQRQKEIIESLREELDAITKKLSDVTKSRDKAIEEATIYKMKNMERDRFLSKEAQMSMEIEDLQRELNKQKLILNQTSMAKLADTFDRKVLHLENELRERDMLICKQNQIINSHRKSPTGSAVTHRRMQPRASVLAAAGNLPSAGSSSESFQNGLDVEAKEALLSFILSDRHNQLANIYNIGRILDLTPQEERAVERHLTKDRFT